MKFTDLCDRCFDKKNIHGIATSTQAFDDLLVSIQTFKVAIVAHNGLNVNYAKAKSDEAHAEENLQVLALGNNELSTVQFDLFSSYFIQAVAAQKANTLQTLYNAVRTYSRIVVHLCRRAQPSGSWYL